MKVACRELDRPRAPAQLALALAASRLPEATARAIYQPLERALVASLDHQQRQLAGEALDRRPAAR